MDKELSKEEFQERIEFNRLWWSDVQEGEPIAEDEIIEVKWLISTIESQQKELERLKEAHFKEQYAKETFMMDRDGLKAENEQLRKERDEWKATCEIWEDGTGAELLNDEIAQLRQERDEARNQLREAVEIIREFSKKENWFEVWDSVVPSLAWSSQSIRDPIQYARQALSHIQGKEQDEKKIERCPHGNRWPDLCPDCRAESWLNFGKSPRA